MKKTLAVESDYIKNNGISSVYSIEHEFTDTTTGEITVGGTLHASTTNGTLDLVTPDAHRVRAASGKDRIDLPDARKAYRFNLHYLTYTELSADRGPAYTPAAGVTLTPERQLAGSHLRVMRYRMSNTGYVTRELSEREFWQKGVRAVMLSTRTLYAGGQGYAWVIFSTDAEVSQ